MIEITTAPSFSDIRGRVRLPRPILPILFTITALAVFAVVTACGGASPVSTPECYLAENGQIVGAAGADCEPPAGATVQPTPTPTPDQGGGGSNNGRVLFITYACATCHELDSVPQSKCSSDGPKLDGINAKGADYIRESILDPSTQLVEGYEDGLMPQDFATQLSADELDTLVTFLSGQ